MVYTVTAKLMTLTLFRPTDQVMQLSIFAITIPPRTLGDLHQKFSPTLGLLHPSFCPGGRGFVGVAQRGRHLSINDFAIFEIFIIMARIGD